MEIKKTPRADLEKDKSLSFLMGLAMALAILFVGFEWGEKDLQVATDSGLTALIDEEEIEMTIQNEPPPPPPPEPEVIKEPDILEIVEDEEKVESIQIASSEDDASLAQVETYVAPVAEEEEEVDENYINNPARAGLR